MAKCRIAPVNNTLSTPQMELSAAVLSKRGRRVIKSEMRFDFERVLQLVDSKTVLSMIHKTSTLFEVYEGFRIGEIQAATDGDLSSWAWISGEDNTVVLQISWVKVRIGGMDSQFFTNRSRSGEIYGNTKERRTEYKGTTFCLVRRRFATVQPP